MRVLHGFVGGGALRANHPWCVAPARASLRGRSPVRAMRFNASRKRTGSPASARAHVAGRGLDLVADGFVELQICMRHPVMIADARGGPALAPGGPSEPALLTSERFGMTG